MKNGAMANGMNLASKNQLKKIAKADTSRNIPQVPLGNLYYRDKKKWIDKGKFCYTCGQPLGDNIEVIDKHRYICKAINTSRGNDDAST